MILSGKNEENKSMKKAKRCLIAVVSGVLAATAVLSGCGQSTSAFSVQKRNAQKSGELSNPAVCRGY